jgi:hypothetical protein
MFNRTLELSVNRDYEERIRKTAQENHATRVKRANRAQSTILSRLGTSLVHLGFHLQRQPHKKLKNAIVPE